MNHPVAHKILDASHLFCPEPVMLLHNSIRDASVGDIIEIVATDPSTKRDIPKFCAFLGHDLLVNEVREDGKYVYRVRKGR